MNATTLHDDAPLVPHGVEENIARAIEAAAASQFCEFTSALVAIENEYAIEALIGPAKRAVGEIDRTTYHVQILIPRSFPFNVPHIVPIAPKLRWNPHQLGDWPWDLHANAICPPRQTDIDVAELLQPHLKHAFRWITAALNNNLVRNDDRYELPHFLRHKDSNSIVLAQGGHDCHDYLQRHRAGVATLDRLADFKSLFRVREIRAIAPEAETLRSSVTPGAFGKETLAGACAWYFAGNPSVEEPHRPPTGWSDLRQGRLKILRAIEAAATFEESLPMLLVGFEVPDRYGQSPDRVVWQCADLVNYNPQTFRLANGFRQQKITRWPGVSQFEKDNSRLQWSTCEDISSSSLRSRAPSSLIQGVSSICVVGVGALGSMLARSLSKSHCGLLTLIDPQSVGPGNVVRHEASSVSVHRSKSDVVAKECLTGTNEVIALKNDVISDWEEVRDHLIGCDLIIDATGEHGVHDFLAMRSELSGCLSATCFVTAGPDFGFLILRDRGCQINPHAAEQELVSRIPAELADKLRDTEDKDQLVWPEPGCYHPTFNAPYHRMRLMADSFTTTLLAWMNSTSHHNIATLYQQSSPENQLGLESTIAEQIMF